MSMENKLEMLKNRHEDAKKAKAYGRLETLFDNGTFFELDPLAKSGDSAVEVLAGYGSVDGCPAYAFSQNVENSGGAMSGAQAAKIKKLYEMAVKTGAPVIGLYDSNGAKLGEGGQMMASFGEILALGNNLSGVVPQISVVIGACQGTAALLAVSADIVIMTKNAKLSLSVDGIGGTADAALKDGTSHSTAADDSEAIATVRKLITLLPSNNLTTADFSDCNEDASSVQSLQKAAEAIAAGERASGLLLSAIGDAEAGIELQSGFGGAAVTALSKVGGTAAGLVLLDGGVLDGDGASKIARFVRFCDAFSLPVITLVHTDGIASLKQAAMLTHAYAEATTVKISVVTGHAIGAAYIALAGRGTGADLTLAWPTAVISALSPDAAVSVLWTEKLKRMKNPQADRAALVEEYKETDASPMTAAAKGFLSDIIDPALTRATLIRALDMLSGKRVSGLPKKHSNIQL